MVKKFKKQIKRNQKGKYIEDKALIKLILQHSKKEKIDCSKFKISSFLECLNYEGEEDEIIYGQEKNLNKESDIYVNKNNNKATFGLSFLECCSKDLNSTNKLEFKSSIFQQKKIYFLKNNIYFINLCKCKEILFNKNINKII